MESPVPPGGSRHVPKLKIFGPCLRAKSPTRTSRCCGNSLLFLAQKSEATLTPISKSTNNKIGAVFQELFCLSPL